MKSLFYPWREVQTPALPRATHPDAEVLVAEHLRRVLALAHRFRFWVNPYHDRALAVDDLAAEFMLAAYRSLHRFKAGRGSFGGWLTFEARSCACKMRAKALRLKRAKVTVGQFAGGDGFDTFAATADAKQLDPAEIAAEREEAE